MLVCCLCVCACLLGPGLDLSHLRRSHVMPDGRRYGHEYSKSVQSIEFMNSGPAQAVHRINLCHDMSSDLDEASIKIREGDVELALLYGRITKQLRAPGDLLWNNSWIFEGRGWFNFDNHGRSLTVSRERQTIIVRMVVGEGKHRDRRP